MKMFAILIISFTIDCSSCNNNSQIIQAEIIDAMPTKWGLVLRLNMNDDFAKDY